MKKASILRYHRSDDVTLGVLKIEGIDHKPLYTLENPWKNNKQNISCIPASLYVCSPYSSLSYKDVYEVKNVAGRTHILFHAGNYTRDTEGCILLGLSVNPTSSEIMVAHSRKAMDLLRSLIKTEDFLINIENK